MEKEIIIDAFGGVVRDDFSRTIQIIQPVPDDWTNIRFLYPVFKEYTVTELMEYKPGFKFKVYQPKGDTLTKRPSIIVYSGGGTLNVDDVAGVCIELCLLGYVVFAVQYKTTEGGFGDFLLEKLAVISTYEFIDFMFSQENKLRYGLCKKVAGIGTSAGAITLDNAAVTANNIIENDYYDGYDVPDIKGRLRIVASISGAVNTQYQQMIEPGGVPTLFYNGQKDPLIPWEVAQAAYDLERAAGISSQIVLFPEGNHTIGEKEKIWYDKKTGILINFFNTMKLKMVTS